MKKSTEYTIIAIGIFFYFYEYILRVIPEAFQHDLVSHLHLRDHFQFGLASATYFFVYTPMQLFVGIACDYWGVKKVTYAATLACTVGTLLLLFNFYPVFLAGRALQGFGSAFAFLLMMVISYRLVSSERYTLITGIGNAAGFFGGAVALTSALLLSHFLHWTHILLLFASIGFLVFLSFSICIQRIAKHNHVGFAELNLSSSFPSLLRELKNLLLDPRTIVIGLVGLASYLPIGTIADLWGKTVFASIFSANVHQATIMSSTIYFGIVTAMLCVNSIVKYTSLKKAAIILLSVQIACWLVMLLIKHPPVSLGFVIAFLLGFSASTSLVSFWMSQAKADKAVQATAIALQNFFIMLGTMIMQPLLGQLFDLLKEHYHFHMDSSVKVIFVAFIVITSAAILFVSRQKPLVLTSQN